MRIVFVGSVEFSKKILLKLISLKAEIVGVCTKESSSFNADFAPLDLVCKKHNIPFKFTQDINTSENMKWIKDLKPDIIFCFGWSSLLKKEILSLAPMGVVGYHPSSLPQNRGRHPLIWALALGLEKSASTFFFMQEGADDGDILSQEFFEIAKNDDARILYDKTLDIALKQVEDFLPKLQNKTYKKIKQNHSLSNTWRKRGMSDGRIDFRMSSEAIYNLVRALSKPYAGAHIEFCGQNVSVWRARDLKFELKNIEPGKVLAVDGEKITIKTYDGAIELLEHDFKKLPKVGDYL